MKNKLINQINFLVKDYSLHLIFFISFLSSLGTLFFSEVEELLPCELCWYQRGFMYSLAVVSFIAILAKDNNFFKYALALSIPGALLAAYNYLLQKTDLFVTVGTCSPDNPCSNIQVEYFGFITIPFMSLMAFLLIALVSSYAILLRNRKI
jgi:disulfide bond formation protein DsbB